MRLALVGWLVLSFAVNAGAVLPEQTAPTGTQPTPPPAPASVAPTTSSSDDGFLQPAELQSLLHKVWLAQFRVNDLLTEVHSERWKVTDDTRNSFARTLEALRANLGTLESWRGQFEKQNEKFYLCYQTLKALQGVYFPLEEVARSIGQNQNPSLGAQYSQALRQLRAFEQPLAKYLDYLLRNQDEMLRVLENNLANCQTTLGYAMRPRVEPAKGIPNTRVGRPEPRRPQRTPVPSGRVTAREKAPKKQIAPAPLPRKKTGPVTPVPKKPAAKAPAKPSPRKR